MSPGRPTNLIQATYKGETGYVTFGASGLGGITPHDERATTYATRAEAEAAAEALAALQSNAEPWDALTGIHVVGVAR